MDSRVTEAAQLVFSHIECTMKAAAIPEPVHLCAGRGSNVSMLRLHRSTLLDARRRRRRQRHRWDRSHVNLHTYVLHGPLTSKNLINTFQ